MVYSFRVKILNGDTNLICRYCCLGGFLGQNVCIIVYFSRGEYCNICRFVFDLFDIKKSPDSAKSPKLLQ